MMEACVLHMAAGSAIHAAAARSARRHDRRIEFHGAGSRAADIGRRPARRARQIGARRHGTHQQPRSTSKERRQTAAAFTVRRGDVHRGGGLCSRSGHGHRAASSGTTGTPFPIVKFTAQTFTGLSRRDADGGCQTRNRHRVGKDADRHGKTGRLARTGEARRTRLECCCL